MCACVFMLARSDTGAGQPRSVDHDTHGRCLGQVSIDRVDGIEVGFGLLRGVQIYEPNEVAGRKGDTSFFIFVPESTFKVRTLGQRN